MTLLKGKGAKWILDFLISHCCRWSVPRIHNNFVGKSEYFLVNAFDQRIEVTAGKVGATNASVEENISTH